VIRTLGASRMWDVSEIANSDPERGALLLQPPSASSLRALLVEAVKTALVRGTARLAAERSSGNPEESRAVVQFWVGSKVFDWFFNCECGYRAQYRADPEIGLRYNDDLVGDARQLLLNLLPPVITVRVLTPSFEDAGAENVATRAWSKSLQPVLSKVWMCGVLIQTDGSQPTSLPTGIDGTRIKVGLTHDWASISRIDPDAWLEIKGAFVGHRECYQPKDPRQRADWLQAHGEA
jgi:hypothetical protein